MWSACFFMEPVLGHNPEQPKQIFS